MDLTNDFPDEYKQFFILGKFTLARETFLVQTFWQISAAFISE